MTEIKQTEDHSRDKYPAFYAIAKILKVEVMHRISDYYGPIVYTKFGESDAGVMPDSQKDAYYAFFPGFGGRLFTCCLNMMERKPFLVSI